MTRNPAAELINTAFEWFFFLEFTLLGWIPLGITEIVVDIVWIIDAVINGKEHATEWLNHTPSDIIIDEYWGTVVKKWKGLNS